jgi:hypothetical protein
MRSKKTKKKSNAHYKGVRYIAKQLKHYQKGKYPSYKKALPDARWIFENLQKNKQKVTLKNIWEYSRTKKVKPYISKRLLEENDYWETLDFAAEFKKSSNKIFFISTISPANLPEIQGGTTINAGKYFEDFVSHCNGLRSRGNYPIESGTEEWKVICTPPKQKNGRWESVIECRNSEGKVDNYGFDPNNPTKELLETDEPSPTTPPTTPPTAPPSTPSPTTPSGDGERAKEIRLIIEGYNQLLRDKIIDKKEWRELVDAAIAKLSKGGNI